MITINLKGGLGNQMFEYATARRLGIKYKKDLVLNTEYFINIPKGDVPRKYQLDIFNIDKNIKIKEMIVNLSQDKSSGLSLNAFMPSILMPIPIHGVYKGIYAVHLQSRFSLVSF